MGDGVGKLEGGASGGVGQEAYGRVLGGGYCLRRGWEGCWLVVFGKALDVVLFA